MFIWVRVVGPTFFFSLPVSICGNVPPSAPSLPDSSPIPCAASAPTPTPLRRPRRQLRRCPRRASPHRIPPAEIPPPMPHGPLPRSRCPRHPSSPPSRRPLPRWRSKAGPRCPLPRLPSPTANAVGELGQARRTRQSCPAAAAAPSPICRPSRHGCCSARRAAGGRGRSRAPLAGPMGVTTDLRAPPRPRPSSARRVTGRAAAKLLPPRCRSRPLLRAAPVPPPSSALCRRALLLPPPRWPSGCSIRRRAEPCCSIRRRGGGGGRASSGG